MLLAPRYPAALGCRTHGLTRLFDVLGGALCKQAPELNTAAGYGTSPYMLYSGWKEDGEFFYAMEILYGGIPGRPIGDGMDGHSWWPLFENIPTEYLEAYYPLRIDGYTTVTDSGGAGLHRGGNGVEKRYVYLEPGHVSIHDDRWLTRPWGVLGGEPGERSTKLLRRADGTEQVLPAKCDEVEVAARRHADLPHGGRRRLEGPARPAGRGGRARRGVRARLAREGAVRVRRVVVGDEAATEAERARQREERGEAKAFDFGPELADVAGQLRGRDRARAAAAGDAAALVAAGGAGRGAGACARGLGGGDIGRERAPMTGFGGGAGFGSRPAVVVVDLLKGFTDTESPLGADLDTVVESTRALLDCAREAGVPVLFTTVVYDEANERAAAVFLRKVPALAVLRPGSRWIEVDARLGRRAGRAGALEGASPRRSSGRRWPRCWPAATRWWCAGRAPRAACARRSSTRCSTGWRRSSRASASATAGRPRTTRTCSTSTAKYGDVVSLSEAISAMDEAGQRAAENA